VLVLTAPTLLALGPATASSAADFAAKGARHADGGFQRRGRPATETITTDEPEGTHAFATPKGPQRRQLVFRQADGPLQTPIFTVPLSGGWRSQSGVQTRKFSGAN